MKSGSSIPALPECLSHNFLPCSKARVLAPAPSNSKRTSAREKSVKVPGCVDVPRRDGTPASVDEHPVGNWRSGRIELGAYCLCALEREGSLDELWRPTATVRGYIHLQLRMTTANGRDRTDVLNGTAAKLRTGAFKEYILAYILECICQGQGLHGQDVDAQVAREAARRGQTREEAGFV
eukprot:CAMPEP_0117500744 /NCGR_PEP_ID=MMETSP0784-20121206/22934_1 /TAXON_ID=39447 /ORGANISM="" /LENGTH=179 /DNA_ID=CAMNT_0005295963 /DNA_START=327 /DNA_END=865 /DNA_ORIENTATION=-